jgi:predicted ATP-dependent endonuclease of OLD family
MVLDQKKEALDLVKAHLDQEIRSNPSEFGIEKITEQVMLNTIIDQVPYKEAFAEYLEAKFEADVAQGAVRAFDARKDALENLVRLNGQQYFAGPKMPRNLTQERERKQEEVTQLNASIARKIRRTI